MRRDLSLVTARNDPERWPYRKLVDSIIFTLNIRRIGMSISSSLRESINDVAARIERLRTLPINEDFIKRVLGQDNPTHRVLENHQREFDGVAGGLIDQIEKVIDDIKKNILTLDKQKSEIIARKLGTDMHKHDPSRSEDNHPWTIFNRVQFCILGIFSVVLLFVSTTTIYTYIIDSGMVAIMQHPAIAWLFSSVPIGLSIIIKLVEHRLHTDKARRNLFFIISGTAFVFGLIWIILYATIFPSMSKSITVLIGELQKDSDIQSSSLDYKDIIFVSSQVIIEFLVASACWMSMRHIYDQHKPMVLIDNPEYIMLVTQEKSIQSDADELRKIMASFNDTKEQLPHVRENYKDRAEGYFHELEARIRLMAGAKKSNGGPWEPPTNNSNNGSDETNSRHIHIVKE